MDNSRTKLKTVQNMLVASIAEVENIALNNIHALKKNIDMEQRFILTFLDVLFAQGHTLQMLKNIL